MGIAFCKYQGFPKLSPCYVINWDFPLQTSVIRVEYCGTDGPFRKYYLDIFSLVIVSLYPKECN